MPAHASSLQSPTCLPHPAAGLVAVYSLKNPGHPEFSFSTAAGVMCLDFHPEHPALLAVGCYDGHIAIFDVRMGEWRKGSKPLVGPAAACTSRLWLPSQRQSGWCFVLVPTACKPCCHADQA